MARNPVMFVVESAASWSPCCSCVDLVSGGGPGGISFTGQVALWLWFTVLFANFAEAMAEGRGKAQADDLRKTRRDTTAWRLRADGGHRGRARRPSSGPATWCVVDAGEIIPGDGEVVEGIASVDESAITGESAPVIREAGGDRSAVTGGTRVLSDRIVVRITAEPGESFLDRMIALVEGAERQKTPNEIALSILLACLTHHLPDRGRDPAAVRRLLRREQADVVVLIALLVCLIPTTIGALLSAIGIAGMDRLVQHNVLAMTGRAVEAAGDVDTLLLDKTGTITLGNRQATELLPAAGVDAAELADAAQLASPGRRDARGPLDRGPGQGALRPARPRAAGAAGPVRPLHRPDPHERRRPATAARSARGPPTRSWPGSRSRAGTCPASSTAIVEGIARGGGTPLVVAEGDRVLGVIHLKDIVKPGMRDRFDQLRAHGHPHRHGHRRQPAHGGGHRRARPGSTTSSPRPRPRPSGLHPRRAGRGQAGRHDRATAPTTPRRWPRPTSAWP